MKYIIIFLFILSCLPNLGLTQSQYIKRHESGILLSGGLLNSKNQTVKNYQVGISINGIFDLGFSYATPPSLKSIFLTMYPGKDIKGRAVQPILHISHLILDDKVSGYSIGLGAYKKISLSEIELYPAITASYSSLSNDDYTLISAVGATISLDVALKSPDLRLILSPIWTITQNGNGIGLALGLSFNFH